MNSIPPSQTLNMYQLYMFISNIRDVHNRHVIKIWIEHTYKVGYYRIKNMKN